MPQNIAVPCLWAFLPRLFTSRFWHKLSLPGVDSDVAHGAMRALDRGLLREPLGLLPYKAWWEAVAGWMARPRQGVLYRVLRPTERRRW